MFNEHCKSIQYIEYMIKITYIMLWIDGPAVFMMHLCKNLFKIKVMMWKHKYITQLQVNWKSLLET